MISLNDIKNPTHITGNFLETIFVPASFPRSSPLKNSIILLLLPLNLDSCSPLTDSPKYTQSVKSHAPQDLSYFWDPIIESTKYLSS